MWLMGYMRGVGGRGWGKSKGVKAVMVVGGVKEVTVGLM